MATAAGSEGDSVALGAALVDVAVAEVGLLGGSFRGKY